MAIKPINHPVQRGRTENQQGLSLREKAIAFSLAFAVCVPPWLLGGMRWWQQLIFLGLALIPFSFCFLLREKEETKADALASRERLGRDAVVELEQGNAPDTLEAGKGLDLMQQWGLSKATRGSGSGPVTTRSRREHPAGAQKVEAKSISRPSRRRKHAFASTVPSLSLLRFPVFWLGLAFLAYIIIGALNYSWVYTLNEAGTRWRMVRLPAEDYIAWLPSGVKAPFTDMNPWRVVILYSTGLLLVCSAWLGLTRRRAVFLVLGLIAFNAFLIALLTILQKLSGAEEIFWYFHSENPRFAGTFIYRNHGAAYLYLGMACALACAFYHASRTRALGLPSGPAPLFLFFAFGILGGLLFAASRGGILFGGAIAAAAGFLFLWRSLLSGKRGLISLAVVSVALVLGGWLSKPYWVEALPELKSRWERTEAQLQGAGERFATIDNRVLATKATIDMWEAQPWTGWGAGSYRWMFTKFQQKYRELFYFPSRRPRQQSIYYAHNDWVQFPAEYGLLGCAPLVGLLAYWFLWPVRRLRRLEAAQLVLYAAVVCFLAHCFFDFLLYNPANLFTFALIPTLAAISLRDTATRSLRSIRT